MRLFPFVSFLGVSLFLCASSYANDSKEKERTALFHEGTALAEKGDWNSAAEKFRAVIAIRSAPKALLALGIAEERSAHFLVAKAAYVKSMADAQNAGRSEDEKAAASALALLIPRIPRLIVKLPNRAGAMRVLLDGVEVPAPPDGIEVAPGQHQLVVEGFHEGVRLEEKLWLEEKQRLEVVVPSPLAPETPPARPDAPLAHPTPKVTRSTGALILATAGLVVGTAGAIVLVLGETQEEEARERCAGQTTACPESVREDADASRTKIVVGNVLLEVGAAAFITGGVWWLLSGKSEPPNRKTGFFVGPTGIVYRGAF